MENTFSTRPSDHRFFATMSFLVAIVVTLGFAQTYPGKAISAEGLPFVIHLHAFVFTCWLVLFAIQAVLVSRGKIKLHQRLGTAGILLAACMLLAGVAASVKVARLGHRGIPGVEFPDAEGFLLLNLGSIVVFAVLAMAGWSFRRNPQVHKRLMLTATVGGLMPPGIARLPLIAGHVPAIAIVVMAFLLTGPVYDLVTRRRVHRVYLLAVPLVILATPPFIELISASNVVHSLASWIIG